MDKSFLFSLLNKSFESIKELGAFTFKPNSFCLMKNYSFIQEFGTVGDTILSDGDNIYIILKDSMKKAQLNE